MDLTSFIPEVITFIAGGGLVGLYTMRQTKEGAKLDNAGKLVEEYRDLLNKYKEEKEKAEQTIEEYKQKFSEINEELMVVKKELATVKTQLETSNLMFASANALKCTKISCTHRIPPADLEMIKELTGITEEKEG